MPMISAASATRRLTHTSVPRLVVPMWTKSSASGSCTLTRSFSTALRPTLVQTSSGVASRCVPRPTITSMGDARAVYAFTISALGETESTAMEMRMEVQLLPAEEMTASPLARAVAEPE